MYRKYACATLVLMTVVLSPVRSTGELNVTHSDRGKETYQLLPLMPFQKNSPIKIASINYKEERDGPVTFNIATITIMNISEKNISGVKIVALSTDGMESSGVEVMFERSQDNIKPQQESEIMTYIDSSRFAEDKKAGLKGQSYLPFRIIYPIRIDFSDGTHFDDSENYSKLKKFLNSWNDKK